MNTQHIIDFNEAIKEYNQISANYFPKRDLMETVTVILKSADRQTKKLEIVIEMLRISDNFSPKALPILYPLVKDICFERSSLVRNWIEIISSTDNSIDLCNSLFQRLHRIILNIFKEHAVSLKIMSSKDFNVLLISCLIDAITTFDLNSFETKTRFNEIIQLIPSDSKGIFIDDLLQKYPISDQLFMSFSQTITFDYLPILLSSWSKCLETSRTFSLSSISIIFQKLLENIPLYNIINILFLQSKTYSLKLIQHLIQHHIFLENCFHEICYHITRIWSEPLFLSRGNLVYHSYLSQCLMLFLNPLTADDLQRPFHIKNSLNTNKINNSNSNKAVDSEDNGHRDEGDEDDVTDFQLEVSLLALLSRGVSAHLDSQDRSVRLAGMRVAKIFAAKMGHQLTFEDLDQEDKDASRSAPPAVDGSPQKPQQPSLPSGDPNSYAAKFSPGKTPLYGRDSHTDSDSESDSEFDAYVDTLDDEGVGDGRGGGSVSCSFPTNYLRECIEMLQTGEADESAYEKQRSGLICIRRILSRSDGHPSDLPDVCPSLVRELLRLGNSFNMERFDELRHEAIQSVLLAAPALAAPVLTWAISEADSIALGSRIQAIDELVVAAHKLAGIPPPPQILAPVASKESQDRAGRSGDGRSSKGQKYQPEKRLISSSMSPWGGRHEGELGKRREKTRIFRPNRLSALYQKEKTVKNRFGPVAHLFFFPVLRQLVNGNTRTLLQEEAGKHPSIEREEEGDGIHSLLPSHALQALSFFVRCSVNAPIHKTLVLELLRAAFPIAQGRSLRAPIPLHSLGVRRAALLAIIAGLEAWQWQRKSDMSHSSLSSGGDNLLLNESEENMNVNPLLRLQNITTTTAMSSNNRNQAYSEIEKIVLPILSWVSSIVSESDSLYLDDPYCKMMLGEIIRIYSS